MCVWTQMDHKCPGALAEVHRSCESMFQRFQTKNFIRHHLVGGLEHEFYFSIFWECHNPI